MLTIQRTIIIKFLYLLKQQIILTSHLSNLLLQKLLIQRVIVTVLKLICMKKLFILDIGGQAMGWMFYGKAGGLIV